MTNTVLSMPVMNELRNIPLFSHLGDDALAALQARLRLRRYRKGDLIIRQGAIGDSMYIIRSGQVAILAEGQNGEADTLITHLGPGAPVGELAPLLAERRTATVRVAIDAELWELRKSDLDELFEEFPSIGLSISRELATRLRRTTRQPAEKDSTNLIAVIGRHVPHLAFHLQRLTGEKILVLDLGGLRRDFPNVPDQITYEQMDLEAEADTLANRLGEVIGQYGRILMSIPRQESSLARKAAEQAEVIVELGGRPTPWVQRFARDGTYWHHGSDNGSVPKVARRIARKRVGLALSSGNARSIAHIGVLQVLEREGIPIDVMVGTSGGGLFGGLYAIGKPLDEIARFAHSLSDLYSVRSLTALNFLPRIGLVRGSRVQRILDKAFGDTTFEQTIMPFSIVAADVITGEEVVFNRGRMAEVVRATVSSVPLFEPVNIDGRWLIDGAAVNPVPASVLRDQVDIIIASSVIVSLQERLHRKTMKQTGRLPNLIGLALGKEEIMEAGIIQNRLGHVDVLIEPTVTHFEGFDFHRADEFIAAGVAAAEAFVHTLKGVLEPASPSGWSS